MDIKKQQEETQSSTAQEPKPIQTTIAEQQNKKFKTTSKTLNKS